MLNISTFSHSYHKNKECFREEPEFYYREGGDKVIVYIPKDTAHKVLQSEDIRTKATEPFSQTSSERNKGSSSKNEGDRETLAAFTQ